MLPKAPVGFEWIDQSAGPSLVATTLAEVAPHFFTTRGWPIGRADASNGSWRSIAEAVRAPQLLRLKQVHGTSVVVHRRGAPLPDGPPSADIIVSDDDSVAIAVQAADCVPLLIADRDGRGVAAAHAGWRGLAAGAPRAAVAALAGELGCRPGDLIAAIGPSIGACCYEVGDEVKQAFEQTFGREPVDTWFHRAPVSLTSNPPFRELRGRDGKWFFDGWSAARDQLVDAGIPREQVHVAALCTASHPDVFCSYRRDGTAAGRIAGVIRARGV